MIDLKKVLEWSKYARLSGHSDYQIKHFIVGKEGYNLYGAFVQAVREVNARLDIIRSQILEYRRADVEYRKAQATFNDATNEFDRELAQIDMQQAEIKRTTIYADIISKYIELKKFYLLANTIYEKLKATGKTFDELEEDFWNKKMEVLFNLADIDGLKRDVALTLAAMGNTMYKQLGDNLAKYIDKTDIKPIDVNLKVVSISDEEVGHFLNVIQETMALKGGEK